MPPPLPPLANHYRPRRWLLRTALVLLACAPFVCVGAWFVYASGWGKQREIHQRQRFILYKVNPNTVLAACGQIRAKQAAFAGNPDWHPTPPKGSDNPDPADPQMPPLIGTLRPSTISILPEGVRTELGGGFYHYGLAEQLPGAPKPALAVKQLVPGLWYYAEDRKAPPP